MKTVVKFAIPLLIVGIGVAIYMYNKPHQNIARAKAAYQLDASDLLVAFQDDEATANAQYGGQVIQVRGAIDEVKTAEDGSTQIVLEAGDLLARVSCSMGSSVEAGKFAGLREGENVTIKGVCSGMLLDVVLERCVLVE